MVITINTDDILSVAETAKILNKPPLTIYRWIAGNKITAIRLGGVLFVPRSEIERVQSAKNPHD